jgi:hypothetical protein
MRDREQEIVGRPIPADEAILDTVQAAQAAAADTREFLRELVALEQDRLEPPRVAFRDLTEQNRPWQNVSGLDRPTRSLAVLNMDPATAVFVGVGGRAARPGPGIEIPAHLFIVLPWAVGDVEIDADPNAALAQPVELIVLRYSQPQAFATGAI